MEFLRIPFGGFLHCGVLKDSLHSKWILVRFLVNEVIHRGVLTDSLHGKMNPMGFPSRVQHWTPTVKLLQIPYMIKGI